MELTRENYNETAKELLAFLQNSPSCFHAVKNVTDMLTAAGFTEVKEEESWELKAGGRYFVTRNQSSVIAFKIPGKDFKGFQIMASHSDSPAFKIKENPEMEAVHCIKLNVEKYGGMICAPWFDRPLSIAGRLVVSEGSRLVSKLVNVDRDLVMIPNLAIHMNRQVNDGYAYNAQKDLLPLYGDISAKDTFLDTISKYAGIEKEEILSHDLFLYNRQKGTLWGANEEFLSATRLDDLQCACASLYGLLGADRKQAVSVHCVLDNEEVGSTTKQGAASTFLRDTLFRICTVFGMDTQDYFIALSKSFMISADNAHAVHPNHTDKADPVNRPYLNEGIVIKYNANQKYCTDGISAAMFKDIYKQADVPYQTFTNRSDMAGGSTLGNISNTQVALNTVDIGLPQLAMHSPYETAGVKDTEYLLKAAKAFFA